VLDLYLSYQTVKVVQIRNWKLGLLHYLIILTILAYVIGYVIIYEKGYQGVGIMIGASTIKLKGNALVVNSNPAINMDEHDVIYPAREEGAFFITTNFLVTPNQTRDVCSSNTKCANFANNKCPTNQSLETGISTGNCDNVTKNCLMNAWCLPENDVNLKQYLEGLDDFSVMFKINAKFSFPGHEYLRDNLNGTNPKDVTWGYNLFYIRQILESAGTSLEEVQDAGAVILLNADWECDFDKDPDLCKPSFSFERIDLASRQSPGYNFRYTSHYRKQGGDGTWKEYRDLTKAYGIRFIFLNSGSGKKFDLVQFITHLGSGLALLGVATVVSDLIVLYVLPKRRLYKDIKYEDIDTETKNPYTEINSKNLSESAPLVNK